MEELILAGANGKVAKRLADTAAHRGFRVVTLNRAECAYLLDAEHPKIHPDSIVINCAGSTNTKSCEQNREKAFEDNVIFASAISKFCERHGLRCYYLSTETVFGKNGSFTLPSENDTPFPQTSYGATKRLGELASADFAARVIRLPLLVDIDDPETVFGKLINRLESGFPIKCSKICYSTPVTYTEAAEGILDCVTQTNQADANTFHITGSQYANVFEILSRLSQNRGLNTELIGEFFHDQDQIQLLLKFGGLATTTRPVIHSTIFEDNANAV